MRPFAEKGDNEMDRKLTKDDTIFDGYSHRPFNPDKDGWVNEVSSMEDYLAVGMALTIMDMWSEIRRLTKENFELKKRLTGE